MTNYWKSALKSILAALLCLFAVSCSSTRKVSTAPKLETQTATNTASIQPVKSASQKFDNDRVVSTTAASPITGHLKPLAVVSHVKEKLKTQLKEQISPLPDAVMHTKNLKRIFHKNLDFPVFKLVLFVLIALGIIILASVLTFQLTASLNWAYFVGGLLIMLAVVGSIITLS